MVSPGAGLDGDRAAEEFRPFCCANVQRESSGNAPDGGADELRCIAASGDESWKPVRSRSCMSRRRALIPAELGGASQATSASETFQPVMAEDSVGRLMKLPPLSVNEPDSEAAAGDRVARRADRDASKKRAES